VLASVSDLMLRSALPVLWMRTRAGVPLATTSVPLSASGRSPSLTSMRAIGFSVMPPPPSPHPSGETHTVTRTKRTNRLGRTTRASCNDHVKERAPRVR
jgi:hypothetical protein